MTGSFGAFGKIPSLGDFFRLNVGQGFVAAWDPWLQEAMTAARERLGEAWEDRYMTAPIWRFALAPGLAGAEAAVGVMMPSVDRVGRKFPLTLVAKVAEQPPLRALAAQETVFSALEDIALDALDDDMTQDRLSEALSAVAPVPALDSSFVRLNGVGYSVASPAAELLLPDLALKFGPNPSSVFSAAIEGGAWLLAGDGLPQGGQAAALFDLSAPAWSDGA